MGTGATATAAVAIVTESVTAEETVTVGTVVAGTPATVTVAANETTRIAATDIAVTVIGEAKDESEPRGREWVHCGSSTGAVETFQHETTLKDWRNTLRTPRIFFSPARAQE